MMHVHLRENWNSMGVDVYIARESDDNSLLLGYDNQHRQTWTAVPYGQSTETQPPTLHIPREAAHALLGALARHLGAVEHPEQLRKDHEHEKRRVDDLIATVSQIAKGGL